MSGSCPLFETKGPGWQENAVPRSTHSESNNTTEDTSERAQRPSTANDKAEQQQASQIVSPLAAANPHNAAQYSNGPISVSLWQQTAAGQLHPSIKSSSGSSSQAAAAASVLSSIITSSSSCRRDNSAFGRHCTLPQQKCSSAQRQAPTKRPSPRCLGDSSQARPTWGAAACSGSRQAPVRTLCHGRPGWCAGGLGEYRLCLSGVGWVR